MSRALDSAPAAQRRIAELRPGLSAEIRVVLTAEHVARFADLSGDRSPLHTDAAFSQQQGFPGILAHGFLAGALVSQLVGMHLPGANGILQSVELNFRRPIVPPASLTVRGEVTHVSESTGQVTLRVSVSAPDGRCFVDGKVQSIVRETTP